MSGQTAIRCPHGVIVAWTGWAKFGDTLPECEHCEVCNPDAVSLDAGSVTVGWLLRLFAVVAFVIVGLMGANWIFHNPVHIFAWLGFGLAAWHGSGYFDRFPRHK